MYDFVKVFDDGKHFKYNNEHKIYVNNVSLFLG